MVSPDERAAGTVSAIGALNRPSGRIEREERIVDSDRVEGPLKEAGGKAKEEWGDLTDDASTEAEGKVEQAEGKVQNKWGETKDAARDVLDDDR